MAVERTELSRVIEKARIEKRFRSDADPAFLLIDPETLQLNVAGFKSLFKQIRWKEAKIIRGVNNPTAYYYYRGEYEDDKRRLEIILRPTMRMMVGEFMLDCFRDPEKKGGTGWFEFAAHIEVMVDDVIANMIKAEAVSAPESTIQKISWD